jgi:hypothetical protein
VLHFRSQREVVELGELVHKLPDPIIGRMEYVRSVLVDVDSLTTLSVAVTADVFPLVYQENVLSLAASLMGENATEKTSTNNEIVVHGLY